MRAWLVPYPLLTFCLLLGSCEHVPVQAPAPSPAPPPANAPAPGKAASSIPIEDFFRNPELSSVHISENGQYLAVLRSWKSRMNIFIRSINSEATERQITYLEDRDITDVAWKGSDYVLFEKDLGGDENTHVYAVNVKSGTIRDLTPFKGVKANLVDTLEESSSSDILLKMNQRDPEYFDLYRVNVDNGNLRVAAQNNYKITHWLIDHSGRPRGGVAADGVETLFYFEHERGQPYELVLKTDFRNSFLPVAMTADNAHVYAVTNLKRNLGELVEVDPKLPSDKFVVRTVFSNPKYDIAEARYSIAKKTLSRVGWISDRHEDQWLDSTDQADWTELNRRLNRGGLRLMNTSHDERVWVVKAFSDRSRGEYYLFDRLDHSLVPLGSEAPWLAIESLAETKSIRYNTRDGLEVQGFLTVPVGREPKNLPTIINPHGGPWSRDEWRFNSQVQFLASRGYAVLQMNFRGSTGYGRHFWEAGFHEWGRKMQDDISDGVKWLISQGIANPQKICIYGASYGGYATLAGVAFTPELYACGVDYVGVSNLFTFMKTIPPYWKPYLDMFYTMVGDPVKDHALLMAASPVFHSDRIKAPLFIAQGANDPRVNRAESDQMVAALRKRGVKVEYMVKENEGHGFINEENRFDFYRAMEKFLSEHLGGAQ